MQTAVLNLKKFTLLRISFVIKILSELFKLFESCCDVIFLMNGS